MYTVEYYSATVKSRQCHLQQHDGPREDHTKSEKDKYHYWYHSYLEPHLKNDTDELIYKTETDSWISETSLGLPKGKCGWEG